MIFRSARGQTLLYTPAPMQAGGPGMDLCFPELFWAQKMNLAVHFQHYEMLSSQCLPEIM